MSTTPEAELAYALISNLQGQVYAEANEVAQMSFDIFKEAGLMVLEKGRMMKSSYVFDMEALVRQRVKVRVAKLSICPCGFPVLAKHIKLGEVRSAHRMNVISISNSLECHAARSGVSTSIRWP